MKTSGIKPVSIRREVCAGLSRVLCELLEGRREPGQVVARLRTIVSLAEGEIKLLDKTQAAGANDEREIFEFWFARAGKSSAKLTPKRRMKIRARIKDGYTVEQIKRAIDGVCSSEWHRGANDRGVNYTELEMILRTGDNVEKYLELAERTLGKAQSEATELDRLKAQEIEALAKGDVDAQNRIRQSIRKARST